LNEPFVPQFIQADAQIATRFAHGIFQALDRPTGGES
jgi:hypothetical protein